MRIRKTDKTWDWCFGKSATDYVRNAYAVALDIKMKILEWQNDCFFALDSGIPWDIRLGSKNQKRLLDNDIQTAAESVEGVLSIYGFTSTLDGRRYRCSFSVYQQYSTDELTIDFDTINGVTINA